MGTLIEAYQAICFSSDFEATHRETVMALVTSWSHRNEREALIRQIDYGPEMGELVEEVVGQIKRTVGENPPFVIEFLSKKAREDTDKILGLLELKERWSWSTL
jgi:Uma2 family endonuclease